MAHIKTKYAERHILALLLAPESRLACLPEGIREADMFVFEEVDQLSELEFEALLAAAGGLIFARAVQASPELALRASLARLRSEVLPRQRE